jgi:hypothetical protein
VNDRNRNSAETVTDILAIFLPKPKQKYFWSDTNQKKKKFQKAKQKKRINKRTDFKNTQL